jgi:nucleotide-binding universal stress UspA family protein
MYKRILIPTDGSEISHRAAAQGIALAKALDASVKALFVIDTRTFPGTHPIVPESMAPHYFSLLDEMRKAGEAAVQEVATEAKEAGVAVEHEVVEGLPSTCILEAAAKMNADLLVMGTHGRSGFAALLLGSTTQACVHGAELPVLLVR